MLLATDLASELCQQLTFRYGRRSHLACQHLFLQEDSPSATASRDGMMRLLPNAPPAKTFTGGKVDMPSHDKQNNPTTAATSKLAPRTPFIPRVAGSSVSAVSTPSSRRGTRSGYNTPLAASRDVSTPVSTLITNNITPRSGSRKSRVDSTNNTPTSTPNGTPVTPHVNHFVPNTHEPSPCRSGLGIGDLDRDLSTKRSIVSFNPSITDISNAPGQSSTPDSKFFFASDAKTVQAPRPALQAKAASFVYANGESIPMPTSSSSALGSVVEDERTQPKLFHVAGSPTIHSSSPFLQGQARASSTLSRSVQMTSPRLTPATSINHTKTTRPASPPKGNSYGPSNGRTASPALSSVSSWPRPNAPTSVAGHGQRANKDLPRTVVPHRRSSSIIPSETVDLPSRKTSSTFSSQINSPTTPLELNAASPPTILRTRESSVESAIPSEPQSPSGASHSIDYLNELAANARRERKVLDLEITNSSLAAINRTLEREMRKQTAELRRYRRLSRSGRLSLLAPMSRSSSDSRSPGEADDSQQSDSEADSKEDDNFDFSEDESVDEAALSPAAMAESDLRHRKKDEKRLQLDLSKHQQLLIDSQKLNQSLKRCLGWTEELINDGRRALEYHVRVSDVELGGRVLVPEEIDEVEPELSTIDPASTLTPPQQTASHGVGNWSGMGDLDNGTEVDRIVEGELQSTGTT